MGKSAIPAADTIELPLMAAVLCRFKQLYDQGVKVDTYYLHYGAMLGIYAVLCV